tara:strand:+ start:376 stop:477 length:102 start_codon:yes stop_codon:yes gene_type:complete
MAKSKTITIAKKTFTNLNILNDAGIEMREKDIC